MELYFFQRQQFQPQFKPEEKIISRFYFIYFTFHLTRRGHDLRPESDFRRFSSRLRFPFASAQWPAAPAAGRPTAGSQFGQSQSGYRRLSFAVPTPSASESCFLRTRNHPIPADLVLYDFDEYTSARLLRRLVALALAWHPLRSPGASCPARVRLSTSSSPSSASAARLHPPPADTRRT